MQPNALPLRRPVLAGLLGALLLSASPVTRPGDVGAELDAIEKELRTEYRQMTSAMRESDEETAASIAQDYAEEILPEFLERMAVLAREHAGTPEAAEAWARVLQNATSVGKAPPVAGEALTVLTTDHIDSEKLHDLLNVVRYSAHSLGEDATISTLETIGARSPHSGIRACALMSLGAVLGEDRPDGDPRIARARELFRRVEGEYATETYLDGRTCAEAARAYLFQLDNLLVGQVCPDFESVDAEGANFKLSDYRGKVVLVDFWGFW